MEVGGTPQRAATPASSKVRSRSRSRITTRSVRTHWARSLSGVQIQVRSTPGSLADRALAVASARWASAPGVERTWICTPDKDLAQCVRTDRVVMRDRLRDRTFDEAGVAARWGVLPASIPDYLALVGDSADGFPGLPGWGAKSAAAVLARFGHVEAIPANPGEWHVDVRSPAALNASLRAQWQDALLFRRLATLRVDVPLPQINPDELFWRGARRTAFTALCDELGQPRLAERPHIWQD